MAKNKGAFGGSTSSTQTVRIHVNFWGMVRDVLTHAMNKGQLLGLSFFAVIVILILRMPPEAAADILTRVLRKLEQGQGISYGLNVILLILWAFHSAHQRRSIAAEMDRIGREKTSLQEQLTNRRLANPLKGDRS